MSDSPYLIVGLGNPGPKYAGNRHNVGFMVADLLAERVGGSMKRAARVRAEVCQGRLSIGGPQVIVVKPLTYMNVSGQAVAPLAVFFKVPAERIIVVHDELDLPYGVVRLKAGGGENGHNGLKSTSQALGDKGYVRARFGIGRPPGRMDPAAFVLRDFSAAEKKELPLFVDLTADAVSEVVESGLVKAQNKFHALSLYFAVSPLRGLGFAVKSGDRWGTSFASCPGSGQSQGLHGEGRQWSQGLTRDGFRRRHGTMVDRRCGSGGM